MPSLEDNVDNRKEKDGLRELLEELLDLIRSLTQLSKHSRKPVRSSLELKPGEKKMPLTVILGDPPGSATYQEFNAAGEPVSPLGVVHFASDNEAVAMVDANGVLTYIAEGSCNIAGADDGVEGGLPASDSLVVNPVPTDTTPVSSTITLTAGVKTAGRSAGLRAGAAIKAPKFVGGKFVK
jgi:hypothetical protein